MTQKLIPFMKGYKATNADMTCTPTTDIRYQFEMNKLFVHEGKLDMCGSGFHFCVFPSGVWSFYNKPGTRVFEIEAYDVLDERSGDGAEVKMVAQKIKFIREIKIGGDSNTGNSNTGNSNTGNSNTGDWNTGNWNTGDWNTGNSNTGNRNTGNRNTGNRNTGDSNTGNRNTGNSNTGDSNTGDSNTGDSNTGNWNTGDSNTGDWNTGNWNTGNSNTGDSNTGNWNTGDWNTGDWNSGNWNTGNSNTGDSNTGNWNTGDWNTGDWNSTNYSSGFFCTKEPAVISFDTQTKLLRSDFLNKYPECYDLGNALLKDLPINFEKYKNIPGITKRKLTVLHSKFKKARKETNK